MLQSGQDAAYDTEDLCRIIKYARMKGTNNIILCLGMRTKGDYSRFFAAGANKYIMKFETANAALYKAIKPNSCLVTRLKHILLLKKLGFAVGSGNICGLPKQEDSDLAKDLMLLHRLSPDMASVAPFIANSCSPYKEQAPGDVDITLNIIALMRIFLRNVLIPSVSALETLQSGGLLAGLKAGANVVTINMTPQYFRQGYVIYNEERKIIDLNLVKDVAKAAGLTLSDDPE
jgi:biotin synthase